MGATDAKKCKKAGEQGRNHASSFFSLQLSETRKGPLLQLPV